MSNGLIIESSSSSALISINKQKSVLAFKIIEPAQNLSKDLLPALQQLLLENGLELKDLNYVAVGIGPGAYTGVRVGAIIGKSLAYSLNIPLIGFESPLAFLPNKCGSFTFIADAKMGQFYLLNGFKTEETVELSPHTQLIEKESLQLYSNRPETLNLDRAKTTGIDDRKEVNIRNMDLFPIVNSREFSRRPKSTFQADWSIPTHADFVIAPSICGLKESISPVFNPGLLAALAFQRFSNPARQEFKLIYYR